LADDGIFARLLALDLEPRRFVRSLPSPTTTLALWTTV